MSEDAAPEHPNPEGGPAVPQAPPRSLKRLAIRGSVWTFAGYGISQVIRLGGNLILTRLLFPEAFGVMALVNVFLTGLAMFSDLGLSPSIVQSPRGEDADFLRTAWTIQVMRGAVLWLGALAISLPAASFYDEPALARFLPIAGFTLFIAGLESTNFLLLQRHLNVMIQTALDIGVQLVSLLVSIMGTLVWRGAIEQRNLERVLRVLFEGQVLADEAVGTSYLWGGIWALIIGTLVGRALRMFVTFSLPGPRMGLSLRKEHVHELIHFGKWIFLASILTFFVNSSDRPVLAKFMDPAQLGVYSIGMNFPNVVQGVLYGIAGRVLFPVYAELARERPEHLRSRMIRVRFSLACVTLHILWVMVVLGPQLIDFLYDDRYREAGVFMQVLAGGTIVIVLMNPIEAIFLSVGNSRGHCVMLISRSVLFVVSMAVGGYFYGAYGIVWGVAIGPALNYPFLVLLTRKYGAWTPLFDAACVSVSAVVIILGLWIKISIM